MIGYLALALFAVAQLLFGAYNAHILRHPDTTVHLSREFYMRGLGYFNLLLFYGAAATAAILVAAGLLWSGGSASMMGLLILVPTAVILGKLLFLQGFLLFSSCGNDCSFCFFYCERVGPMAYLGHAFLRHPRPAMFVQ